MQIKSDIFVFVEISCCTKQKRRKSRTDRECVPFFQLLFCDVCCCFHFVYRFVRPMILSWCVTMRTVVVIQWCFFDVVVVVFSVLYCYVSIAVLEFSITHTHTRQIKTLKKFIPSIFKSYFYLVLTHKTEIWLLLWEDKWRKKRFAIFFFLKQHCYIFEINSHWTNAVWCYTVPYDHTLKQNNTRSSEHSTQNIGPLGPRARDHDLRCINLAHLFVCCFISLFSPLLFHTHRSAVSQTENIESDRLCARACW